MMKTHIDEFSIEELEAIADEKYGPGQFNWVIGRTKEDGKDMWFFYAGKAMDLSGKMNWEFYGYEPTIKKVMYRLCFPIEKNEYLYKKIEDIK